MQSARVRVRRVYRKKAEKRQASESYGRRGDEDAVIRAPLLCKARDVLSSFSAQPTMR